MLIDKNLLIDLSRDLSHDDPTVTQDQYELLTVTIKSLCDNHPASQIDLNTVVEFIHALNTKNGLNPKINTKLVDLWLETFLKANIGNFEHADQPLLDVIFCTAIGEQQLQTVQCMLDTPLVTKKAKVMVSDSEITPLLFCLNKDCFNQEIFDLLLPVFDINFQTSLGVTALYKAVESGNQYAFDELLKIPSLELKGYYFTFKLFDVAKDKPYMFHKLIEQANEKFTQLNIRDIIYSPIALLSEAVQEHVKTWVLENLKKIKFQDDTVKQRLIDFMQNPAPLPFARMNRLSIVFECVVTITAPYHVKQAGNTCGPATLMQHLAMVNPEFFALSVIELAELPQKDCNNSNNNNNNTTYLPACITTIPQEFVEDCKDLWDLWIHTVRHNFNPVFGYSKKSAFEMFLGMTSPYQLALMFEAFGYEIKSENLTIRFSQSSYPGFFLENLRKKLQPHIDMPAPIKCHSNDHAELSEDARFEQLKSWCSQNFSKPTTILVNPKLLELMIKGTHNPPQVMYIEPSHFVNIQYFQATQTQVVFSCFTYGQSFSCSVAIDEFKKGYLGGLFVQAPSKEKQNTLAPGNG